MRMGIGSPTAATTDARPGRRRLPHLPNTPLFLSEMAKLVNSPGLCARCSRPLLPGTTDTSGHLCEVCMEHDDSERLDHDNDFNLEER